MKTAILNPSRSGSLPRALFALLCAIVLILCAAPKAFAQAPGFPDILDDIFGGNTQQQQQGNPYGQTPAGLVYIENIPLQVGFDSRGGVLPPEATLIVTAIAPPPPNVRRAAPLVMGETRLLISRLTSPLQMVVAVPSDMAREVDYARIEARIVDANGVETHRLEDTIQYSGGQPPFLNLVALNSGGAAPVYTPPSQQPISQPYIPPSGEQIQGTVSIPPGTEPKRGATLILELRENGLAGGASGNIVQTKRIDIDQINAPYQFALPLPAKRGGLESPDLTVWIEDWAGRKTHVLARPVPVDNAQAPMHIKLDAMVTGQDAVDPTRHYVPPAGVTRTLAGEAQFDAYKGLPAGSTLTVRLRNGESLDETLASKTIPLDGLSGYVRYALPVEIMNIQGRRADPLLDAILSDKNGRTLFTARTLVTLPKADNGAINIQMQPTANY